MNSDTKPTAFFSHKDTRHKDHGIFFPQRHKGHKGHGIFFPQRHKGYKGHGIFFPQRHKGHKGHGIFFPQRHKGHKGHGIFSHKDTKDTKDTKLLPSHLCVLCAFVGEKEISSFPSKKPILCHRHGKITRKKIRTVF
jgi:hypothetical protein